MQIFIEREALLFGDLIRKWQTTVGIKTFEKATTGSIRAKLHKFWHVIAASVDRALSYTNSQRWCHYTGALMEVRAV